jgi:hypothetical protein
MSDEYSSEHGVVRHHIDPEKFWQNHQRFWVCSDDLFLHSLGRGREGYSVDFSFLSGPCSSFAIWCDLKEKDHHWREMISRSRLALQSARRLAVSNRNGLARRTMRLAAPQLKHLPMVGGGAAFYSTERILELRGGNKKLPTIYDSKQERENCGVGLIASLKSIPSRDIVEKADEMLVRMSHRGGCGCDPNSGDGSGTYHCFYGTEITRMNS